jgi:hypothetical protein
MLNPSLLWLLPLVFIFHDFEEIIMMNAWMKRNKNYLQNKFPILGNRILSTYKNLSTASFSLAVAEEFLILVISVIFAVQFHWYLLWVACFMAFSLHLLMHIFQWIIIRKYIPAIITSFISLIYSYFAFTDLINSDLYSGFYLLLIAVAGLFIMAVNLFVIHKLAALFEKFLLKYER